MTRFINKYADHIKGVLSGFDRLVFRGTLRPLAYVQGFQMYLNVRGVRLTGFGAHAAAVTAQLKEDSLAEAERVGAPIMYLPSSQTSKEGTARAIAAERKLELVQAPRKCLHLYHYWMHPVFGFMNARIQTW